MIPKQEIMALAAELQLQAHVVEKDYALGWFLAGIAAHPVIGQRWLFKGGTCLKKCYFETYRFSEDLDFTLKAVFDTLSDSAKRQLSEDRPGMFLVGFQGIDGEQLLAIAGQDQDRAQSPTELRAAVRQFLASKDREHVVGVGFLSESALMPEQESLVESGGTAYYFPKRESSHWSEDFNGLFQWMPAPTGAAIWDELGGLAVDRGERLIG